MLKASYEELAAKIKEKSGLSDDEIKSRVDAKIKLLSGLVSREGAAHIIANELGIKLFEPQTSTRLEIKNLLVGMRDVELVGKISSLTQPKSFQSNGREGKVASLAIIDGTGQTRLVLWNSQAETASNLKIGDIVKVKGGYVRERNNTNEVHVNERGKLIINPEGEKVDAQVQAQHTSRKRLSELDGTEGNAEILATIVQVFEPRFFEICTCGKRARPNESGATCDIHGQIKPTYSYVLNALIDDGTDSIRAVFFREQAQKLLNKTNDEMLQYQSAPELFETARNNVLGSNIRIIGRPTKNEMFNRIEMIANSVTLNPDPEPEIARLEEELKQIRQEKS